METRQPLWNRFDTHTSGLNAAGVHIFKIRVDDWFKHFENKYLEVLSPKELLKAGRYKSRAQLESYLVRKYILRLLLGKALSIEPSEVTFTQTGNKKPKLEGIEFNTTHSKNYALIALSPTTVGIDLEFNDEGFNFESLLSHCFDQEERIFISEGDAKFNFYALWTRKEALLKASAEGLINDLSQVNTLSDEAFRKGDTYYINTMTMNHNFILSIASKADFNKIHFWSY